MTLNHMFIRVCFTLLVEGFLCVLPSSAQPEFRALGFLPGSSSGGATGVSPDGRIVIGSSGGTAFRWSLEEGMTEVGNLPFPYSSHAVATGASADGSVIVGYDTNLQSKGFPTHAFRWTAETGVVPLLPHPIPGGLTGSSANAVSWDGDVIAGYTEFQGCLWNHEGEYMAITGFQDTYGVSGDGLVVVGRGDRNHRGAARWTSETGVVPLGDLPGGKIGGIALAASSTGDVIVGIGASGNVTPGHYEAFRWTSNGGITGLGDLPGGIFDSAANAVSSDGSIVVGQGQTTLGLEAFIWDELNGMRNLRQVLIDELGLQDSLQNWILRIAFGISADGRTIVGVGMNPQGLSEAWVVYLDDPPPPPCPADFNADGFANSQDFFDYLTAFFTTPTCPQPCPNPDLGCPADFNRDCLVNTADFFDFLAAFFTGC